MKTGSIIILSGPSGSGKTTLYKHLLARKKFKRSLVRSVSMTTRPQRKGEKQGRDYFFISERQFLYKRRVGHFLEWQKVFQYYYGTPKKHVRDAIKEGKHVLLCIDVKGARVVLQSYPEALKIFVKAPSMKILRRRLLRRATEGKADLHVRLATARKELAEARFYDYIIINDDLKKSYKRLEAMLHMELFGVRTEKEL